MIGGNHEAGIDALTLHDFFMLIVARTAFITALDEITVGAATATVAKPTLRNMEVTFFVAIDPSLNN